MTMATDEQVDEFIALIDETRPVQLFHHIDEATVGAGGIMRMLCCAKVGDDPVTAGAIAEELHVSTARVAALLKNMEAKGLISRERAASDARVTVVTLTPHGRALADAAYRNVRNHAAAIIDSVGIERLRAFFETRPGYLRRCSPRPGFFGRGGWRESAGCAPLPVLVLIRLMDKTIPAVCICM